MTKFRRLSLVVAAAILTAPVWGSDSVRQTALYRQINPVPHVVEIAPEGPVLDISGGVYVVDMDRHGLFGSDVNFLNKGDKKDIRLTVDFHPKKAMKAGVKPLSGAYLLTVSEDGVSVLGYDERGAFYGLQTLRQIVELTGERNLPCGLEINDWPDLPARGVVEGFYGTPEHLYLWPQGRSLSQLS